MKTKEHKWMRKIQRGNRRAFKQLFDRYSDYAHRTAYAITKNQHDAADVVQETFIKVYRYAHTFDQNKSFRPWFYRILVNEAKRLFQKLSKDPIQVETDKLEHYYSPEILPDFEYLDQAMDQLNDHERVILVLKYVQLFTEKEIADILELKVNTVKSRLYRARQKLKSIMGGIDHVE